MHHLAALSQLDFVDVVGICDPQLAAAQALADRFRIARVASRLDELADLQPQAVYVLTPPAFHAAIALQAMEMGCHVLVEKPMAEPVEDCEAMITPDWRGRASCFGVNHSDLFDPVLMQAVRAVRDGRIGEVLSVEIVRNSEYPPYAGGPLPGSVTQDRIRSATWACTACTPSKPSLARCRSCGWIARRAAPIPTCTSTNGRRMRRRATASAACCCRGMQGRWRTACSCAARAARLKIDRFLQTCRIHGVLPGQKFIGIMLNAFFSAIRTCSGSRGTWCASPPACSNRRPASAAAR